MMHHVSELRTVRNPDGGLITSKEQLPPPHARWARSRKKIVARAVIVGLLDFDETLARYEMDSRELEQWLESDVVQLKRHGIILRVSAKDGATTLDGETVDLAVFERGFMGVLARHVRTILSKKLLHAAVLEGEPNPRAVDLHVDRIRRKLATVRSCAGGETFIKTIKSGGYKLSA